MTTRTPARTRTRMHSRDIACIRIGFEEYLLDADKAMQVLKLFREAIRCQKDFNGRRFRYVTGNRPELEMTLVDPDHVVMPNDVPALESRMR
ncbi:hypothetical protein AB3X91_30745 [Paraburkholderia sp. BR14263]|uniref:hypothetical protein n=1 Tax=unclassified Paraburkholderia TaxID=2615204 RepID=UPI0034CE7991